MSKDDKKKCYRPPSSGQCKCDQKGSQKPPFDLKSLKALLKPSPGLIAAGLFTGVVLFDTVLKSFFAPEHCDCGCCYIREREKELKRRAVLKEKQCAANLIIAEQKRKEAEQKKKEAEAKKKVAEEAKKKEAEAKKKEAEAKKKEAEAKKKEAEAKKKEEEAKKKEAEAKKKEAEAKKKQAEEAKKKQAEEAKKKQAEAEKKEAEAKKKAAC